MPVIFQKLYKREDARRNANVLYVFGDNVQRRGMGGQAGEMRHEPNAVGVATKYAPSMEPNAFFSEDPTMQAAQQRILDDDMKPLFEKVKRGGVVIWPTDGIGTGLSELPQRAPSTFEYLETKLAALIKMGELNDKEETQ